MEDLIQKLSSYQLNIEKINNNVIKINDLIIELIPLNGENEQHSFLKSKKDNYLKDNLKSIFIFENEYNTKFDLILSKIKYILKLNQNELIKIRANKCTIHEILSTKDNFLNENHIQGKTTSAITLAAFYENKIVAMMLFDNERNMAGGNKDKETYELTRFCVKNGYQINGIANKMLKYFIKNYKCNNILSFADKRFTLDADDNLYTKLGFNLVSYDKINYYYYKDNTQLFTKYSFSKKEIERKHPEIFDNSKTETELTKLIGLSRIHDAGKYKYILNVNNDVKENDFTIYMIKNKTNGKMYIGQTTRSFKRRFSEHIRKSKVNEHLKNAFLKYGYDGFHYIIIDTTDTIEKLNELETYYIKLYDTINREKGYNFNTGGNDQIPTDEVREKMSKAHKGRKHTPEWIEKRKRFGEQHHCFGKKHSEEYKKNLSEKMKGSGSYWFGKKRPDYKTKYTRQETDGKKVVEFNRITGEVLNTYPSIGEASRITKKSYTTIANHCKNKVKIFQGEISFRFLNTDDINK